MPRRLVPSPCRDPYLIRRLPSRATIRTIHQLGDLIRATRAEDGLPIEWRE